jgi:porphobilinogen synthase
MNFPDYRPRRMRRTENLRRMIRETRLAPSDFIYPLFIVPGSGVAKPIGSLPGQFNYSIDKAVDAAAAAADLGIPGVILFGVPEKKDAVGSEAWKESGIIQKAIRAIKKARPELTVMADACFCEYTDHGHCGILHDGELDNDASLENLARTVVSYAKAGVDVVAPSGMLDGFVTACRESLPRRSSSPSGDRGDRPIAASSRPHRGTGRSTRMRTLRSRRGSRLDRSRPRRATRGTR